VAGAALSFGSCGARTELLPAEEPCSELGSVRACSNVCGTGNQRCENGFWQGCRVAPSVQQCRDACGSGVQSCEDGELGRCEVAPVERSCANECGAGVQRCEVGRFGACEVPVTTRPCADACGAGREACENGAWGGCEVPRVATPCESVCGSGEEVCEGGRLRSCNAPQPKPPVLDARIRDFGVAHPDFEIDSAFNQVDTGIVQTELGPDDKPVYANQLASPTTSGRSNFDQWYRDVPGVNLPAALDLPLAPSTESPGLFVFEDTSFFPIDGQLLGNESNIHNYHFTLEVSTRFQYLGGEIFRFTGDDDMWVFINRRLAIDLGGIHASLSQTVDLDREATRLGIVIGQEYPLHFFFAERHTVQSNFTIETSISEPGSCE